ncbi:MAG: DUF1360 domain-containing protein [Acidimicrobiales bacterium]|nr:DUF1360 domain-containing protein [Acidimicrobiales bacterium]
MSDRCGYGPALAALELAANLAVDVVAVHRLTRLVTSDELTRPIRERVVDRNPDGRLAYLAGCPWCASVWAGLAVAAARRVAPRAWRPLGFALAASTVTGLLEGG